HVQTVGHEAAYGMSWKTLMKMMSLSVKWRAKGSLRIHQEPLGTNNNNTVSRNLYCQWELSPGSGNALCILFPTR
nr:hypothetical protein [Tanacetum cinerariifolium]